MRAFTFQRKVAVIRTLKEPKIKKKKINLDRIIYFGLIAVGLFFLLRYCYKKVAVIEGNGQILMDKVDVNFTQDIRVRSITINEGDTVRMNQRLFTYTQSTFDNDASLVLLAQQNENNIIKNNQKLLLEVQQKEIQLKGAKQYYQVLQLQEAKIKKLVLLDVYTIDKLEATQRSIQQNKLQISLLANELSLLRQQLQFNIPSQANIMLTNTEAESFNDIYISPINGVIGQILKNENESCYKTENVMTIHNTDEVFIKAYFTLDALEYIKKGETINVMFPDNTTAKGTINKVYIATYEAPDEFQKTYEPTERNILAEIIPLETTQKSEWASYHKLNVKVIVGRL